MPNLDLWWWKVTWQIDFSRRFHYKFWGAFHQAFGQCFSLTTVISYWNPCIWLAESKLVSEKHWQNAWWNAPWLDLSFIVHSLNHTCIVFLTLNTNSWCALLFFLVLHNFSNIVVLLKNLWHRYSSEPRCP